MRVVIDLQGAQTDSRYRGIGRYSLSLAKAIARNRGDHDVIIALNGEFHDSIETIRAEFVGLLDQEKIRVWHAPGPVKERDPENYWRREVAERIREAFLQSLQPDVVHIMSLFEGYVDNAVSSIGVFDMVTPVSVSQYDLIPLLNQEKYLEQRPKYKHHYLRKMEQLGYAASLLTISRFSSDEAIGNLEVSNQSVINVSAAVDPCFHKISLNKINVQMLRKKFGLSRKSFILYSGGGDDRKNLSKLVSAYAELSSEIRNELQLVLAGNILENEARKLRKIAKVAGLKSGELVMTGYVTSRELAQFYNLCKLFVFPSMHEGFGLPPLEAMACGAPVIASNASSIPEVVGRDDALFDASSVKEMSDKMAAWILNDELRQDFSQYGLARAQKFSWNKSAHMALSEFEAIVSSQSAVNRIKVNIDELISKLLDSIASIPDIEEHKDEYISIAHCIALSIPRVREKQLFVDVSELSQRDAGTGVQRVTRSILKELLENPPRNVRVEPVYATTDDARYRYARSFYRRFTGRAVSGDDEYIEYLSGDMFLGLDLQHSITLRCSNTLTMMREYGVKVFFVVYDLLPLQFPHHWPSEHLISRQHALWIDVISRFDGAICISKTVADELSNWIDTKGLKSHPAYSIDWFHLGADVENSVPSFGLPGNAGVVENALKERISFLMVGTIEPRKGHAQTLLAMEVLWARGVDVNLVVVGKKGWLVEKLESKLRQHPELGKRLFWLEGISDEYLEKVYALSTCLIAASEGEGFGLPLIEAAQHELPIIARDISVFREVAGTQACYFDSAEPSSLATCIEKWLELYRANEHPKSNSLPWLTWYESTKALLKVLYS